MCCGVSVRVRQRPAQSRSGRMESAVCGARRTQGPRGAWTDSCLRGSAVSCSRDMNVPRPLAPAPQPRRASIDWYLSGHVRRAPAASPAALAGSPARPSASRPTHATPPANLTAVAHQWSARGDRCTELASRATPLARRVSTGPPASPRVNMYTHWHRHPLVNNGFSDSINSRETIYATAPYHVYCDLFRKVTFSLH